MPPLVPHRWLILGLLTALGLLLRLWGLWGHGPLPGEWNWRLVDQLSWTTPLLSGVWYQGFFSFCALIKGLWTWLGHTAATLVGQPPAGPADDGSALALGRALVALLGTLQVLLVYWLGRRLFRGPGTALLAAALVAVSPALVAQSHLFSLEVPLGVAVLGALWLLWRVADAPRPGLFGWSGLVLGLAAGIHPAGLWMLLLVPPAFALAWRRQRPVRFREPAWGYLWFVGLFLVGAGLGAPAWWLGGEEATSGWTTWAWDWPLAPWPQCLATLWPRLWGLGQGWAGLEVAALWLAGAWTVVAGRRWRRALLLPPVVIYGAYALLFGGEYPQGWQALWLPPAALVAARPVVLACRRLDRYAWQVAAAFLACLVLAALPLFRSLQCGYLLATPGSLEAASAWLEVNARPEDPVWSQPGAPLDLVPQERPWQPGMDEGFLVSLAQGPDPAGRGQQSAWQSVQSFGLGAGWGMGPGQPAGLNPALDIAIPGPRRALVQPLSHQPPPAGWERGRTLVFPGVYGKTQEVMLVPAGGKATRVLHMSSPPPWLGLHLVNLGADLAEARVSQGPWSVGDYRLYPGQSTILLLEPRRWPPMVRDLYPVSVELLRGGRVLGRVLADPLTLGRRLLEQGSVAQAEPVLAWAAARGRGLEAHARWAVALTRLGRFQEAKAALDDISQSAGEAMPGLADLALAPGEPDLERLGLLTGYDPGLLERSTGLAYDLDGPPCQAMDRQLPFSGPGYHGMIERQPESGSLRLWLEAPWPAEPLRVGLETALEGVKPQVCRLEVWAHGPMGSQRLAQRELSPGRLAAEGGWAWVPLRLEREGAHLELRLDWDGPGQVLVRQARVSLDLGRHLRSVMRDFSEAWGRLFQFEGRFALAVKSFERVLQLDQGAQNILLPLAHALMDTGQRQRAQEVGRLAEEAGQADPERLAQVAELYAQLGSVPDAQRVERLMADLRPSLKKEAVFEGGMALLGYDLSAAEVTAGQSLKVTYYWQARRPPKLNYFIFVHLRGTQNTLIFDHLLDGGRVSMTELSPGQVVREEQTLDIPSQTQPGRYRLLVGLWDPGFTGKRQRITAGQYQGDEEIPLAEIEVR